MALSEANKPVSSLPGYNLCEYQLVLVPHEELRNKVRKVKLELAEKYKLAVNANSSVHINLSHFVQLQMMEERVCNRLRMIAMAMPAFKVELSNYGSLPSHTIYINVETKTAIQLLVKQIKQAQRLMKTPEHKPYFVVEPYLPVARKLVPWQYEQGWLEYSHKHFSGKFIAKGMQLLRRSQGGKAYQVIREFEFLNMPVVTVQGELF